MSKPLWVCVTCAEDFTRKSSAKRHRDNNQIHNQMPQIVRYVEYLIGRAKGDYPPPTIPPRLHGMKTTRQSVHSFTHDSNYISEPAIIKDSTLNRSLSNITQQAINDTTSKKISHNTYPVDKQVDNAHKGQQSPMLKSQQTLASKLEKIREISKAHFSPERLEIILARLACRVLDAGGDDSFVDEYQAELLHKINLLEALSHLSSSKKLQQDADFPQQLMEQDPMGKSSSQGLNEAAMTMLSKIEQAMSPYPPEYVRNIIAELTTKCIITGDCSFLGDTYNRHRRNAEQYSKRH
jgi:hypothetical protein